MMQYDLEMMEGDQAEMDKFVSCHDDDTEIKSENER
jgi:hypothetical protein